MFAFPLTYTVHFLCFSNNKKKTSRIQQLTSYALCVSLAGHVSWGTSEVVLTFRVLTRCEHLVSLVLLEIRHCNSNGSNLYYAFELSLFIFWIILAARQQIYSHHISYFEKWCEHTKYFTFQSSPISVSWCSCFSRL